MENKTVLILHSDVLPNAPKDEQDVFDEVENVSNHLQDLGYEVKQMPFHLHLEDLASTIKKINPCFIFNLAETVRGDMRLIHFAPAFFEHLKIPYTGCPLEAIFITTNKLLAKKILESQNILTPKYLALENINEVEVLPNEKYLLKSIWEHASVGMDEKNFNFLTNKKEIRLKLAERALKGMDSFAEEYIDGREFNISMLSGNVLPCAEIKFLNYPDNKAKIVGYQAKWDKDSFECKNTVRTFDFTEKDKNLLDKLGRICEKCWKVFNLKGSARVDFRVNQNGQIYVLEINTNPCISSDSGFVAATQKAGMHLTQVIEKIIDDTFPKN